MSTSSPLLSGQTLELDITACLSDGRGLARHDGLAIFVTDAVPGERVRAILTQVKPRQAAAVCTEKLSPAPDACPPACAHASECGGCPWQTMPYLAQLTWKKRFVSDAMQRIARIEDVPVLPIVPSPATWGYRNKMEFAFAPGTPGMTSTTGTGNPEATVDLGLRRRGSHGVVNVTDCRLQTPLTMKLVARARELARAMAQSGELLPWNPETRTGFWRYLVVREPAAGGCLVECITAPHPKAAQYGALMADALCEAGAAGVVLSRRTAWSDVAYGEEILTRHGETGLTETVDGLRLHLGAGAFFQVNTPAAALLYAEVARLAALAPVQQVWDLYSGCGSIGLYLARHIPGLELLGVEQSAQAVRLAQKNAASLGITASWKQGAVGHVLKPGRNALKPAPDLVIVDPPRAGLEPEVVTALLRLRPPRIIYVSCDPATLARDTARLAPYRPVAVRPVDLFPHTPHVECAALFACEQSN